jgi:hypothetical protein
MLEAPAPETFPMRISPSTKGARAWAAGALFFSLSLTPALAHISTPFARPLARAGIGPGPGHFAPLRFRALNRFAANRFKFNRFGFDRFDDHRFRFDGFRFNRFGANASDFGLLGLGLGYWGYPTSPPTAPAGPIIVGAGGPPVVINVYAGDSAGAGEVGAAGGACPVVHLLNYDKAGRYVGERQVPAC